MAGRWHGDGREMARRWQGDEGRCAHRGGAADVAAGGVLRHGFHAWLTLLPWLYQDRLFVVEGWGRAPAIFGHGAHTHAIGWT